MLYAVVPVKTLVRAKSRLAPALSLTQRLHLARRFLHHVLGLLGECPGARHTIVVSADPSVLHLARNKSMIALPQSARGGINRAVTLGCALAKRRGAGSVVVIPTDLPYLTADALRDFARPASRPTIRIAADRHRAGTNALYLQPVRTGFARFGEESLNRHRMAALLSGSDTQLVHAHPLAFDVDVPADLPMPANLSVPYRSSTTPGY